MINRQVMLSRIGLLFLLLLYALAGVNRPEESEEEREKTPEEISKKEETWEKDAATIQPRNLLTVQMLSQDQILLIRDEESLPLTPAQLVKLAEKENAGVRIMFRSDPVVDLMKTLEAWGISYKPERIKGNPALPKQQKKTSS